VYPALLPLMRTPRLPVVDWTDAPCRFKWTRPFRRKTKSGFCSCAITFQTQCTAAWSGGGLAQYILNLGCRWTCCTIRHSLPPGRELRYHRIDGWKAGGAPDINWMVRHRKKIQKLWVGNKMFYAILAWLQHEPGETPLFIVNETCENEIIF